MNATDPVKMAKEIVGKNEEDDYILDPTGHAEQFKQNAPELVKILSSSNVSVIAEEYKHYDNQALQAQLLFKKWSKRGHWTVFFTVCFSAGLLSTGALSQIFAPSKQIEDLIVGFFAAGSVVCAAFAGVCINRIRTGRLLEQWMQKRAEAETQRLAYFDTVVRDRSPSNTSSSILLPLLQLEYFRRFQLDVQLTFYRVRGQDHYRLADKALSLSVWAMGGVAVVNSLAGVLGFIDTKLAVFAGIALILQAFASRATNIEAVNQDSRNAERYERTRAVLAKLSGKLDKVRQKILTGNKDILRSFVSAVHGQLSLEHRQWLKASDERLSAVGALDQQLKGLG
jgi:hypothetical protein